MDAVERVVQMSESDDEIGAVQLTRENLMLRGAVLRNTKKIWGVVVGAGDLTKLKLNQNVPKFKFSRLEKQLNIFLGVVFAYQTLLCLLMAGLYVLNQPKFRDNFGWGFPSVDSPVIKEYFYSFLTWFIL